MNLSNEDAKWFVSVLALYGLVLIFFEATLPEIAIVIVVYFFSWFIVSSLVKRNIEDGTIQNSITNELKWFGGILTIFLLVIILIGTPSPTNVVIIIATFTLIWVLRSVLIKFFASGIIDNDPDE